MKQLSLTNSQYADTWEKESFLYKEKGIYQRLYSLLPEGKVLEIGCGCGFSTLELLKNHEVLALECNPFQISKANVNLGEKRNCVHKCDILKLNSIDKKIIHDFKPDIIVGCFIGANGLEILKHIKDKIDITAKIKKYRENIEDVIASNKPYFNSVSTIQLVNRGKKRNLLQDDELAKKNVKDDYNYYVFSNNGYEVADVSFFDWSFKDTELSYVSEDSSMNDDIGYRITSILVNKIDI